MVLQLTSELRQQALQQAGHLLFRCLAAAASATSTFNHVLGHNVHQHSPLKNSSSLHQQHPGQGCKPRHRGCSSEVPLASYQLHRTFSTAPEWLTAHVTAPTTFGSRAEVYLRLPPNLMLIRHAESQGLDEAQANGGVPNHQVQLSAHGEEQAGQCAAAVRELLRATDPPGRVFLYSSPFRRCRQTCSLLAAGLGGDVEDGGLVEGYQEDVNLREQDWGNFLPDYQEQQRLKEERLRFGRFYFRFPCGESVADVHNRMLLMQLQLVNDMCSGRFGPRTTVALVTHGLTLRVFLMRWLRWSVHQFLQVFNAPNAEPIILEKVPGGAFLEGRSALLPFLPHDAHCLYRLTPRSVQVLRGVSPCMASPRVAWTAKELHESLAKAEPLQGAGGVH